MSEADDALDNPGGRGGHIPPDESRTINALEAAAAALHERATRAEAERDMAQAAASTERARAVQAETEREAARIAAARAEGEASALKEAVRLAEDTAHRAQEAARLADKGRRDADARAAALQVERDAAQHRAVEAVTVMGQLAHRLEDYQRQVTEAARQATEAEQRATAADAARHEIQNRLAQLEEEAKNASMQGMDLAELETAQARATEAEQRAIEAKRLADEADRRATTATERLDRFQRERIAQAQAAAENTRAVSQEVVPLWRRVFGRRRRP